MLIISICKHNENILGLKKISKEKFRFPKNFKLLCWAIIVLFVKVYIYVYI